jgi:hypothetical protein
VRLARQSVPEARAVAALAARRGVDLDGNSIVLTLADDAERAAKIDWRRWCLGHSGTSDEAIVRTVLRGTSPIAVTFRPRNVVE